MLSVLALVGRPNVGKSTLFNALTRTRDALVANEAGLTRDRRYGIGQVGPRPYIVVDTGGLTDEVDQISDQVVKQAWSAIEEADAVLFMVDARAGSTAGDQEILARLRSAGKNVWLVVNKTDGLEDEIALADFYAYGLSEPAAISATHRRGVNTLMERLLTELPPPVSPEEQDAEGGPRVAVIGRPNVGKSTLVNRLLGEERVLALDLPGTTRDAIDVAIEWRGVPYTLVDTAGIRRRARVHDGIEKFSVIKALQAIDQADVVILVLDATLGIADQDATLLGHVLSSGRALVIAVNKWDGLDGAARRQVREQLHRKLVFADFANRVMISALHGSGLGELMKEVAKAHASAFKQLPTNELTKILEAAVTAHPPPLSQGRTAKMRYAHSGGRNPPRIIVHGNRADSLPASYKRYLMNTFRKKLALVGTPIALEFRSGDNPYKEKKNKLTDRQIRKRRRLKKFVGRKGRK